MERNRVAKKWREKEIKTERDSQRRETDGQNLKEIRDRKMEPMGSVAGAQVALLRPCRCAAGGRGARARGAHGVGQRDGERVIVLHEGGVLVVQHQLLQGPVQVVGLRKAQAGGRAVDDAVLSVAVHPMGWANGWSGGPPWALPAAPSIPRP